MRWEDQLPFVLEVAAAREHLRTCQRVLAGERRRLNQPWPGPHRYHLRLAEFCVLGALSWLWDAQERWRPRRVCDWT